MSRDYYYDFSVALHRIIKERIYGNVRCDIDRENDTVIVEILGFNGFLFDFVVFDVSEKVLAGGTTITDVADEVVGQYRKTILKRFLKPLGAQ